MLFCDGLGFRVFRFVEVGLIFQWCLLFLAVEMAEIHCSITDGAVRGWRCSNRWALPFAHRSTRQEYFLRELVGGLCLGSPSSFTFSFARNSGFWGFESRSSTGFSFSVSRPKLDLAVSVAISFWIRELVKQRYVNSM